MIKLALFLSLFFIAIPNLLFPSIHAQGTSDNTAPIVTTPGTGSSQTRVSKVCVKVGEPAEPLPAACTQLTPNTPGTTQPGDSEGLAKILAWDEIIVSGLGTGVSGYFNKMLTNHTEGDYSTGTWPGTNTGNLYWCTYSIVDSYRLAGIEGLDKYAHGAVVNMRKFWMTAPGYLYVDYTGNNQNIQNVRPGFAMFMEQVPGEKVDKEHVNMIKEISLNPNGDGYLITNDSNSSSISHKYTVEGWRVLNTVYPVQGFGGI